MATRRPKVPRATPAAPRSPDTGDGGDVVQGDFGGVRGSGTASGTGSGTGTAASAVKPAAGNPAAGVPGSRSPGSQNPGPRSPETGERQTGVPPTGEQRAGQRAAGPGGPGKRPAGAGTGPSAPNRTPTAKRGTDGPAESLDPVPAKAFSGRMLALAVVMVAITIMLAPTVKIFLDKRAEIAALQADITAKQAQQTDLKRQVSRWQDPNYVKQQARDRINMVMPGETGYWVFGSDLPAGQSGGAAGEGSAQDPADLPWVDALWQSIRRSATD
nr:septum formation initiator family protein [Pseudarthrobacter albicanus]